MQFIVRLSWILSFLHGERSPPGTTEDTFYSSQFVAGCVSIPWQNETIDSDYFNDISEHENEANVALGLDKTTDHPVLRHKRGFFYRLLRRGGCLNTGPSRKEELPTKL